MIADRRQMLGGLLAAMSDGLCALDDDGRVSGVPRQGTDASLLAWCVGRWGADAVADALVASLAERESFDARDIKQRLDRESRKQARRARAGERRERHAGNETLYCGPLVLTQSFGGRECRTAHRRRVLVGITDRDYVITGIGRPACLIETLADRDDDGERIVERGPTTRAVEVPAGSRVLIDLRRGLSECMACEVVRTADGRTRLHVWLPAQAYEWDDTTPRLAGGVAWETPAQERVVGLLGLPIGGPHV